MTQTNLQIKRGDSASYTLYFKAEDGAVINITGYKIWFVVKEKIIDTDLEAKIFKLIETHVAPTEGKSQISLSSTETNLIPKNYIFDVQIKTTINEIITVMEGIFTVTQDVCQSS